MKKAFLLSLLCFFVFTSTSFATKEKAMYHIGIVASDLEGARIALLPGDLGRVQGLAEALGPAKYINSHREYTSYLADLKGSKILVCSTGMGGPSVAI